VSGCLCWQANYFGVTPIERIQIITLKLACDRKSVGLVITFNGFVGKENTVEIIQDKKFWRKLITFAFYRIRVIRLMF
jgi:hypothetical protein